jgi:hypothetical protein
VTHRRFAGPTGDDAHHMRDRGYCGAPEPRRASASLQKPERESKAGGGAAMVRMLTAPTAVFEMSVQGLGRGSRSRNCVNRAGYLFRAGPVRLHRLKLARSGQRCLRFFVWTWRGQIKPWPAGLVLQVARRFPRLWIKDCRKVLAKIPGGKQRRWAESSSVAI